MNIVFLGTPDFAVPCLRALLEDGHRVSLVVTQRLDYCSLIVGDHTVVTAVGVIDGGRVACPNLESAVDVYKRQVVFIAVSS